MAKEFQVDKLLGFMQAEPEREWMASDFQHSPRFIGYEAGPRLCDLCNMGLVCRVGKQGRFVLFALTEKGRKAWSVDDRYKLQEKAPKTDEEHASDTNVGRTEESEETDELPEFLRDDRQLDPEESVGDLSGEDYPKSENPSMEQYKDGFIVKWGSKFITFGFDPGYENTDPTTQIIAALYEGFGMDPVYIF